MNQSVIEVFVEQPLDLPGSANKLLTMKKRVAFSLKEASAHMWKPSRGPNYLLYYH